MKAVKKKRAKLLDDPIAVTTGGHAVISVTHLDRMTEVIEAIERLVAPGQQLFVGVVVPARLRATLLKEVDDATADLVGRVGPMITEASRPRTRRAR